jgi:hypothetical protein
MVATNREAQYSISVFAVFGLGEAHTVLAKDFIERLRGSSAQ